MGMTNTEYKRRVYMTLSRKTARAGLRKFSSSQKNVDAFHATVGISTEVGELTGGLQAYLSGESQLSTAMILNAHEEAGDILYYVVVLANTVKVKVPTLTSKPDKNLSSLTPTQAALKMGFLAAEMLGHMKKVFYGVKPTPEEQKAEDEKRLHSIANLLKEFILIYWHFCFSLLGVQPHMTAQANISKLAKRYPAGYFDSSHQEARDTDAEAKVISDSIEGK